MTEQGMRTCRGSATRAMREGGTLEASEAKEPGEERTLGDELAEDAAASTVAEVIPARGPAAYVAEFIGTFALVLFITLVVSEFATAPPKAVAPGAPVVQPFIDWSVIGLHAIRSTFDSTWALLADRVVAPALEPNDVEIVREQVLTGVRERRTDPDNAATELADSLLYGRHPYAIPTTGTGEISRAAWSPGSP